MRLLRLELEGFKSFAEHTTLDFGPGITCIVGPNGCGKSNIVDAVRWVLGELNPRTLRGKSMQDVIFHGNRHRKPAQVASVLVTFLDEDRKLGLDQREVQVGRKLFRTGDSEYFLNGERCRLKDIRQLFMDTGIGVETYSVMEQGKVDRLLQAGPKDRRYIFEEAAGISKFKSQRKETLRRLERVQTNLDRLGDVISEVDSRLSAVKKQAHKAQQYQRYEAELQELGITLAQARDLDYATKLADLLDEQAGAEEALDDLKAQREAVGERHKALGVQLAKVRDTLEQVRRDLVMHREQKTGAEDQLEQCRLRASELTLDKKRHAADQERLRGRIKELERELERLGGEAEGLSHARQAQIRAVEQVSEEEAKLRADGLAVEDEAERLKNRGIEALEARSRAANELATVEAEQRSLVGREQRVVARRVELRQRVQATGAEQNRLREAVASSEGRLTLIKDDLEAQTRSIAEAQRELEGLGDRVASTRDARARATSRLEVLQQLEARREGMGASVRWLLERGLPTAAAKGKVKPSKTKAAKGNKRAGDVAEPSLEGVLGTVADLIDVPESLALPVAGALGSLAEAVVLADRPALLAAAEALREADKGGVVLIALDDLPLPRQSRATKGKARSFQYSGDLARSVQVAKGHEGLLENLLGGWQLAGSLEEALPLAEGPGACVVTYDGHRLEHGRVHLAGEAGGLIMRKQEIAALTKERTVCERELAGLESERSSTAQRLRELQGEQDRLTGDLHSQELGAVGLRGELDEHTRQQEALREEDELLAEEADEIKGDAVALVERGEQLREAVARHDAAKQEADSALEAIADRRAAARVGRDAIAQQVAAASVLLAQTEEKEHAARALLDAAQRDLAERRHELEAAQSGEQQADTRAEENTARVAELTETAAKAAEAIVALEAAREARAAELLEVTQAHAQAGDELEITSNQAGSVREQLAALAVKKKELEVARNNLHQRTAEELGVDLQQLAAAPASDEQATPPGSLPDEDGELGGVYQAPAAPPLKPLTVKELRKLEQQVLRTKRKIKKLGPINPEAIAELEEHQSRADELHAQRDDMTSARDQLAEIVAELDNECKSRFLDRFTLIRDNFRALFRKLFGGGKADLILEDPDDLLETGIEIIARPPGKQPRTISLLSGGERAMTAIALLFSVYQTRPSPFCLLDEIDAPLDQANIDRFTQLVREFLRESQFVVITHSKQTMQVADTLFGVTSGTEAGVSRVVSVQLEKAQQLVEV